MGAKELIMVTGGCRSGKSEFAEKLAGDSTGRVVYLATSIVTDEEFASRVKKHKMRRPSYWHTVEEPLEVDRAIAEYSSTEGVILVDSLSSWLTNLMYRTGHENWEWDEEKEKNILLHVERFAETAKNIKPTVIVVADEVGFGLVPPYPEGRVFRDLNGRANQIVARQADGVYFVVAGIPVEIK